MEKNEIEKSFFLQISRHLSIRIEIRNSSQIAFCGFFDLYRRSKMDSYLKGDKT